MLAKGEVDIGLTFISEIITEPGVEVVGPLPRDISTPTVLVGYVSAHTHRSPTLPKRCCAICLQPKLRRSISSAAWSRVDESCFEKALRRFESSFPDNEVRQMILYGVETRLT